MDPTPLRLIAVGIVVIAVGSLQARGPLATIRRLDQTAANLDRYEKWRGKRAADEPEGPTGADVMRAQMRQRVILWGGVAATGVVLVLLGLFVA